MILNPNCSEQVFRLSGDLEYIKKQVLNMIDCIENEDRKPTAHWKKIYDDARKKVKNVKTLGDFQKIGFTFTCNYETFFVPENDTLVVATCNNHIWDSVDYEPMNQESYYEYVKYNYYDIIAEGKTWIAIQNKDKSKSNTYLLEIADKNKSIKRLQISRYSKGNPNIQLKEINGIFYNFKDSDRIPLVSIRNKKKRERIAEKVLAEVI